MLKSKLVSNSRFYLDENATYPNAHLVTNEAHNAALGIKHIGLRNPETTKANAPLFKVSLTLDNEMVVFGDIFANKDGQSINIRWPQDTFTNPQGQAQYINKVTVPLSISSQVLRYATTFLEVTDAPVQQVATAQAPEPVVAQPVAAQPVAPQVDADHLRDLSKEELESYIMSLVG